MTDVGNDTLTELRDAIERFASAAPSPPATRPIAAGSADDRRRWSEIDDQLAGQIFGRSVLIVGQATDYDAAAFANRGAARVVVCDGPTGPDPVGDGTFDIVHCNDLLHRVPEPVALLAALRRTVAEDGTLVIGSMLIDDPERSEYLRFVPDRIEGDPSWWFVPGRLAFRWLVQSAGFEIETEFGEHECPRDGLPIVSGYLLATRR